MTYPTQLSSRLTMATRLATLCVTAATSIGIAHSATNYSVVTSKSVNKSTSSQTVDTSSLFGLDDKINAFVTLNDFERTTWPKVMRVQWYNCDKVIGHREFTPESIDSQSANREYHLWFWINAKQLGVGDGRADIYADGKMVGSSRFNVQDAQGQTGSCAVAKIADPVPAPVVNKEIPLVKVPDAELTAAGISKIDAVFKYNGGQGKDLRMDGVTRIDDLINTIKVAYARVDKVSAVGHADFIGDDDYNMQLSLTRADTVRNMLNRRGIPKDRVITDGKGETQPVKMCNEQLPNDALIECLSPNRRVEIVIEGIARK